jgi:hypothetical protein
MCNFASFQIPIIADIKALAKINEKIATVEASGTKEIDFIRRETETKIKELTAQANAIVKPYVDLGHEDIFMDQYCTYVNQRNRKQAEPS